MWTRAPDLPSHSATQSESIQIRCWSSRIAGVPQYQVNFPSPSLLTFILSNLDPGNPLLRVNHRLTTSTSASWTCRKIELKAMAWWSCWSKWKIWYEELLRTFISTRRWCWTWWEIQLFVKYQIIVAQWSVDCWNSPTWTIVPCLNRSANRLKRGACFDFNAIDRK